ncbi:cytochrome [Rhodococcus sp. ACPA4]|uniref:cytochrome P450 n=1 Tax=Rhodococcus sp. ACPA4 TaxID=2028571 RepID=UPI000BB11DCA|nr:cytochrome P450 [Rhodococcus sp. ACPA4]PBC35868.1 cytochrome [Rhodococcus sp. ACPA4]
MTTSTTTSVDTERFSSDIDLFSAESLADPYDDYRTLRDIGPAAYMAKYDMWGTFRYDEVKRVLGDPHTFISGRGIAMSDTINTAWAEFMALKDGEEHAIPRRIMMQGIGPKPALAYQSNIDVAAKDVVDRILEMGEFDGVPEVAQRMPSAVFMYALGAENAVAGPEMLRWATDSYHCTGPEGTYDDTLPSVEKLINFVASSLGRDQVRAGSLAAQAWAAADAGKVTDEQALGIIGVAALAGLDTTASLIGNLLLLFARHPAQWAIVRDDPSLVPSAVIEGARMESTAQWFTRVTSCEVQLGEITIPAGSRMLHSYASANRDERHYPNAHIFDVRRNPTDHLAFGYGLHSCVGKNLSGLEVTSLFKELARRVDRIELNGEPHLHPNNIIRGMESVPLKIYPR